MRQLNWSSERPTKPGEYWLSLPPNVKHPKDDRVRPAYVYESRRCMVTLNFDAPDAYEPVLVVGGSDETASVWPDSADQCIDINNTVFDGAKWSRRETPADPFAKADSIQYVILDTRQIVGNCAMFWRPDGAGYTCDLNDAGLYDKTKGRRETDIYVPIEVARSMSVTHVRVETLERAGYWSKPQPKDTCPQRCEGCSRFVKRGGWLCAKCAEKGW